MARPEIYESLLKVRYLVTKGSLQNSGLPDDCPIDSGKEESDRSISLTTYSQPIF